MSSLKEAIVLFPTPSPLTPWDPASLPVTNSYKMKYYLKTTTVDYTYFLIFRLLFDLHQQLSFRKIPVSFLKSSPVEFGHFI